MSSPSPVRWLDLGDGRRWMYSEQTGRGFALDPVLAEDLDAALAGPRGAALRRPLEERGLLGKPELEAMVPVHSRWCLLFPESGLLWHACPMARGPGGFPFAAMSLDDREMATWQRINGARTVARIAADLSLSTEQVLRALARWTPAEVQAVQLRARPVDVRDRGTARLLAPPRPRHGRDHDPYAPDGTTRLAAYHQAIETAERHFDDRETTFAHVFEPPHPALGDRPFGRALRECLEARWGAAPAPVLEVGPGSGAVCEAWQPEVPGEYWRLDLAPALLEAQARRCPGTASIEGSATAMPLADECVGWLISNEVIADLAAGPGPVDWPIAAEPGQTVFNVGAFAMVAEVARVLRPGGRAFLSEFGAPDELPTETTQLDHPEVSIHFGQVARVAEACGLRAELLPMAELLGVRRQERWLSRPSFEALRAWTARQGQRLEARAWTEQSLVLSEPVQGLWWVPVDDDGPGPRLDRLWCLLLEKPA